MLPQLLTKKISGPYDLTSCIISTRGSIVYHYEQTRHASAKLAPINSCTKSILSALFCIAMEKDLLPAPDTPAGEFFPELRDDPDERKQLITLRHLLTMTAGFQWDEFGGRNSFPKMSRSPNWIDYILAQPLSDEPGTRMVYNSGVSQMLAKILEDAIDTPITQFAEQYLFGPLGIEQYEWKRDPQNVPAGGFGMHLTAYDMLRFGLLYLHRGIYDGRKVVAQDYVHASVEPFIAVEPPERGSYGWHWWVDDVDLSDRRLHYYYARGFGGQFIFVVPSIEAVIVTTRKRHRKDLSPHDLFRTDIAPFLADLEQ